MDVADLVQQHGFDAPLNVSSGYRWASDTPVYLVTAPVEAAIDDWYSLHSFLPQIGYWPVIGWDRFQRPPFETPTPQEIVAAGTRLNLNDWLRQEGIEQAIDWSRESMVRNPPFPAFQHVVHKRVFPFTPPGRTPIALVPTDSPWKVPAYIDNTYGDPPQEVHVAIMKRWYELWGAELVAAGPGEIEMRVLRPPANYEAAFDLAKEQFTYCPDLVLQNTLSVHALAELLMQSNLWWFWWD